MPNTVNPANSRIGGGERLYCHHVFLSTGSLYDYDGDLLIGFYVSPQGWLAYHGINTAGSTEINSSEFSDVVI